MENTTIVKITISSERLYNHVDDVIYYRSGMSVDFAIRWRWFFDYLTARVKVAHPRQNVKCVITSGADIMLGKEWHEHRRQAMIKTAGRKIRELESPLVNDDLFGFNAKDRADELTKWRKKLSMLQSDIYPIPDFPEYINKIKEYMI